MLRLSLLSDAPRHVPLFLLGLALTLSCMHNRPEAPVVPIGPDSVEADSAYSFKTWSAGQDSGPIHIRFDWGDGDTSSWLFSGDTAESSHSWNRSGVYRVCAQAHDDRAEFSEWSAPRTVACTVPSYPYRVIDSVTVSDGFWWNVLVPPPGDYVYLAEEGEDSLWIVRSSDMQLVHRIRWPYADQMACSPDGRYLCGATGKWIGFMRMADRTIVDSLPVGDEITSIAFAPDGEHVYVATGYSRSCLTEVRSPDLAVEDTVLTLGSNNHVVSMRVSPDGTCLYAADGAGWVRAVRLRDHAIEWQVPVHVAEQPDGIVLNPTGSYLYGFEDQQVLVLETGAGVIIDSVPLSRSGSAEISADGSFIYVRYIDKNADDVIAVVRTTDNEVVRVITIPGAGIWDAVPSPDGQRLYATWEGKLYVLGR
jgi:DNA-binding beta-propeller fold protein YncE